MNQIIKLTAACAFASLTLLACGDDGTTDETTRDEDGAITEGGELGALAMQAGDCLAESPSGEFSSADGVPCDGPHALELFHTTDLPDGDYPGDDAITATVEEICVGDPFTEFVGVSYDDSELNVEYGNPTEESWNSADDRGIWCAVVDPAGEISGSLEGSGR